MGINRKVARKASGTDRTAAVGIADALFTSTQQRVLGIVFGQPDRSFLGSEIIARARAGSGAVQRSLARLADSGLVVVRSSGRQKFYQANAAAPVFEELVGLVRKTVGLLGTLREALAPVAGEIELAAVYGSVARGEAKSASDVDLLVVSDTLTQQSLFKLLANAEERLGRSVRPTLLRGAEFRRRCREKGSFVDRVLRGKIEYLIGGVDSRARVARS